MPNGTHFKHYFLTATLYGFLNDLNKEYARVQSERAKRVTAVQVAYDTGAVSNVWKRTTKPSATKADELDCRVVQKSKTS